MSHATAIDSLMKVVATKDLLLAAARANRETLRIVHRDTVVRVARAAQGSLGEIGLIFAQLGTGLIAWFGSYYAQKWRMHRDREHADRHIRYRVGVAITAVCDRLRPAFDTVKEQKSRPSKQELEELRRRIHAA